VFVVPNPIGTSDVAAERAGQEGVLHVGFLGTDTDRKGFDMLPGIARQMDPERTRLLVFARKHTGLPAHISSAWKALEEMPDRVELCGRVSDVRTAYARCDVVLCPSRMESFCRVAAEAMANGLPVVGSDIPAVREVLADGNAGLLVPPGDEVAAATAIGRLRADSRLRTALATAGLDRSRDFEPATITDRFVELYHAGLNG
jgi:glycosyltransferase involved in cell wall biosynthesis